MIFVSVISVQSYHLWVCTFHQCSLLVPLPSSWGNKYRWASANPLGQHGRICPPILPPKIIIPWIHKTNHDPQFPAVCMFLVMAAITWNSWKHRMLKVIRLGFAAISWKNLMDDSYHWKTFDVKWSTRLPQIRWSMTKLVKQPVLIVCLKH